MSETFVRCLCGNVYDAGQFDACPKCGRPLRSIVGGGKPEPSATQSSRVPRTLIGGAVALVLVAGLGVTGFFVLGAWQRSASCCTPKPVSSNSRPSSTTKSAQASVAVTKPPPAQLPQKNPIPNPVPTPAPDTEVKKPALPATPVHNPTPSPNLIVTKSAPNPAPAQNPTSHPTPAPPPVVKTPVTPPTPAKNPTPNPAPTTKPAAPCALAGDWHWFTGGYVQFLKSGQAIYSSTSKGAPVAGASWTCDPTSGLVTLNWTNGFIDSLKLSADGMSLGGTDNMGVAVSAVRSGN